MGNDEEQHGIYRAQGATPLPWATVNEFPDGVTPLTTAQLQQAFGPTNSPWLHFLATSRMIDGQQIVDANAQVLWYDVRCNQDYFDYVTAGQYPLYNTEGQEAARADANFTFNFPPKRWNSRQRGASWDRKTMTKSIGLHTEPTTMQRIHCNTPRSD